MGTLLNESQQADTITSYDRCYGGHFDNPYGGYPDITFFMQRARILSDGTLISTDTLPNVCSTYQPGVIYPLFDPTTGADTGQTFTSDEAYAILYSLMRQAVVDAGIAAQQASDQAAAAAALAAANAAAAAADAAAVLAAREA